MLDRQNRVLLSDALTLPENCELLNLYGTTYSCTFDMLTAIVLWADGTFKTLDELSPLEKLNSLLTNRHRVKIWCNRGYARLRKPSLIYSLFDEGLQEVVPPEGASFHPKFLLLRFRSNGKQRGPVKYRLVITSRNFVETGDWDVLFSVDGEVASRKTAIGSQLSDFLNIVSLSRIPEDVRAELSRVQFELPMFSASKKVKEMSFHFQESINNEPLFDQLIPGRIAKALIMSPFVNSGFLFPLRQRCDENPTVISTQRALDEMRISQEDTSRFNLLVVDGPVPLQSMIAEPSSQEDEPEVTSISLHAKVYAFDAHDGFRLLFGSANATSSGWKKRNTEVMMQILFADYSVDKFIKDSLRRKDGTWQSFLRPYVPQSLCVDETETNVERLHSAVSKICIDLKVDAAASLFTLSVTCAPSLEDLLKELAMQVTIQPISETGALEYNVLQLKNQPATVLYISIADVTPFMLVHIRQSNKLLKSFILKGAIDWGGITPDDKSKAVVRKIVSDRSKFFAYLRLLLSGFLPDSNTGASPLPQKTGDSIWCANGDASDGFTFEELVRTLSEDPRRVRRIERFVRLCTTIEEYRNDNQIRAFLSLWDRLRSTYQLPEN